ncbi:MAG: adenylate kinase [Acidobacteriota bacterium]|nr:adenylate kinase [Acidobacteriota bacterium]MDH3528488.1 adenylate kinase [Acidobacteriota bacterium]
MSRIIVLIGAPGAGKGTQARLLQSFLGVPQISTGDMFREMKTGASPLAREVQSIMDAGGLVSDEVTFRMVQERTSREDCSGSYVLDGFPRTPVQAKMLEQLAQDQGKQIEAVLIDVPFDQLEKRLTGRRSCPVCGEIYNIFSKPPEVEGRCDHHPEARLEHRSDDNPEMVKERLETYQLKTQPLLDYYAATERLRTIEATGTSEEIYQELERTLASNNASV